VVALIGDDETSSSTTATARASTASANARVSSIMVDEGDLQVQGIVVGLIRKFHR